jgi:hypothetical protein
MDRIEDGAGERSRTPDPLIRISRKRVYQKLFSLSESGKVTVQVTLSALITPFGLASSHL